MKNQDNINQFNKFEEKIKSFRQTPKKYSFTLKNRLLRQINNALCSFTIWLGVSLFINILMYYYFISSSNKIDSTSLISIILLFLTIASRNYTVNLILFDTLGNLGKNHIFHTLVNRIGFFHRFMGISTLGWFFVHYQYNAIVQNSRIAIALLILISIIIITAVSIFRRRFHNTFENIHRYLGYLSAFLLLIYYFQVCKQLDYSIIETITKPQFIILVLIVTMLISPWIGVKRIYPKLVHVGPHVIGIKIDGEPSFGTYSKISLKTGHYHPFGDSMLDFNDMKDRTLYLTPAGDRTSEIVYGANKGDFLLEKCIIKKSRHKGFMYHHALYDHILIVVTGGGIAPIIPCLVLNNKTKIDVLWIGRDQAQEFTEELLSSLLNKIDDKEIGIHIINTTDEDLKNFNNENYVALALEAHNHYKPEAVFVMSNQNLTIDMISAFKENHIKTYGATFDS